MTSERKKAQIRRIMELKERLGAVIYAHYYQRSEVKALSDFTGGSRAILRRAAVSRARSIVVCGVDFMERAVARLRPDVQVAAPRADAACPFSQAAGPELVRAARALCPGRPLAAGMKAREDVLDLCDLDLSLEAARDASLDRPLAGAGGFCRVGSLARSGSRRLSLALSLGRLPGQSPAPERAIPGDGGLFSPAVLPGLDSLSGAPGLEAYGDLAPRCAIHAQVTVEEAARARAAYPGAMLCANGMCVPEVKGLCDVAGDSDRLAGFVAGSGAGEFVVFCEAGLAETLSAAYPEKVFRETETEMFCPSMKLTNVKDVLKALEDLEAAAAGGASAIALESGSVPDVAGTSEVAAAPAVAGAAGVGAALEAAGSAETDAGLRLREAPEAREALAAFKAKEAMEALEAFKAAGLGEFPGGAGR
ncbi:MAG: quinolinate synthase NadA [Deltaproteobacteria bacterium]|jgi:quinolinate synthase|nr:quinolinate synthase NadA [Deltaproteobacteria bacterium]